MIAAALSALLLSAGPQLEAAASAGGGYDSNLNLGTTASAIGSGFAAVRASGGASLELGTPATTLYGGLRFDDEEYPSYPDLTTRTAGLEASLVQGLGDRAALVLTPWVAWSWAGDPARDASTLAAQLTLRVKPLPKVAVRAFYGHVSKNASDPVFSSERDRVGGSVEWRLAPRTFVALAGSLELRGDEVFYRTATGGGGLGMGRMSESFGRGQEAYRASATSRAIGPSLEVGLDRTFYLLGSLELRVVRSGGTDYPTQSLFVGLGARI